MTIELSETEKFLIEYVFVFYQENQSFSKTGPHQKQVQALKEKLAPFDGYAVLLEEGGEWVPFCFGTGKTYNKVHAIRFEDGRIWDCVNGFRD